MNFWIKFAFNLLMVGLYILFIGFLLFGVPWIYIPLAKAVGEGWAAIYMLTIMILILCAGKAYCETP